MQYFILLIFRFILLACLSVDQLSFAANKNLPEVNILTWWGYLVSPWVQETIMKKCHVKISYDEYYTNDDFMRRFHQYKDLYDILIFPNMDYLAVKNEIINNNSNIYKNSNAYEKYIRRSYNQANYPHNITYFLISVNGFLYNPNTISLSKKDTISQVFEKAKSKIVILSEEPIYVFSLLNLNVDKTSPHKAFSKFSALTKGSKIIVTNTISNAYSDPQFAFAYTWPGISIYAIETKYKNFRFLIHPKFSLVSADLLAALNNRKSTECVANVMSSKEFLSKMQNDALYFSPYGDSNQISDKLLKQVHNEFFYLLPKLKWFTSISEKKYNELSRAWYYYFRLNLNDQKVK